jgi:hypothetical protein
MPNKRDEFRVESLSILCLKEKASQSLSQESFKGISGGCIPICPLIPTRPPRPVGPSWPSIIPLLRDP